ncbi:MAG: heimdallarchaeosortase [Promethearchaeota archaeon]
MVTVDAHKESKTETAASPPPIFYDNFQILFSIFAATIIGMVIYFIPSYWLYEHLTRDYVLEIIKFLGVNATKSPYVPDYTNEAPGIRILFNDTTFGDYWIVRACTGMQAGAILVALILVTDAPLRNKLFAVPFFLWMLFTANVLRIAFHMLLVSWGISFFWAHDVLSKPIGFVGTLIFAMAIEKSGVPIIDTFADWMDWALQKIERLI